MMKISPKEAKKIAQKHNEMPGVTVGIPTLKKENGRYVYTVLYIYAKNGTNAGHIDIDAQTGGVLGGAGKDEAP